MKLEKAFQIIKNEIETHNDEVESNIDSILTLTKKSLQNFLSQLEKFLNTDCIKYAEVKRETYEKYKIDNSRWFNFFESISDKWYRENFHTDILYTILNPETTQIGNRCFVQEFIKFLGIEDRFDCTSEFKVIEEQPTGYIYWTDKYNKKHRKKGSIDILIKNETQAIIIENKINYAPDMDNQLVRYMKYVEEKLGIKTYTVVYLTLTNDTNKKPPLIDSYDYGFQYYAKKLNKESGILKEVYAVDVGKCFARNFLSDCCERLNKEKKHKEKEAYNISYVYIDQYKVLLNHLGGNVYMSEEDKKLIKEIYSDKEKIEVALDFISIWENKDEEGIRSSDRNFIETIKSDKTNEDAALAFEDLWNRRAELLYSVINDLVNDQIENSEYILFIDGEFSGIRKDFGDLYVCFYIQKKDKDCGIGFWRNKASQTSMKSKSTQLKRILEESKVINGFCQDKDIYKDADWICRQIDLNEIERNKVLLPDLVKDIVDRLNYLDKEYGKIS